MKLFSAARLALPAAAACLALSAQAMTVNATYIGQARNEINGLLGWYSQPNVYLDANVCGTPPGMPQSAMACYPNRIALGTGFLQQQENSYGNYVAKFILAHEWGHTVQFRYGIQRQAPYQELQADCVAGSFARYAETMLGHPSFIAAAVRSARAAADYTEHGTPSQRDYYARFGYANSVNVCLNYV